MGDELFGVFVGFVELLEMGHCGKEVGDCVVLGVVELVYDRLV